MSTRRELVELEVLKFPTQHHTGRLDKTCETYFVSGYIFSLASSR